MRIALYSRNFADKYSTHLFNIFFELEKYSSSVLVHEMLITQYPEIITRFSNIEVFRDSEDLDASVDFFISLGGDGTILDAVTLIRDKGIPVLGINFGRLGFLSSSGKDDIKATLLALKEHAYIIDKRALIHVDSDTPLFADAPFGLNDFTISKKDTSPMIKIKTYLNGEFLNNYWSDGLIVSTPAGSTAYNMSCNGPILFPATSCFVITPIAPHHLNTRPVVIPNDQVLSFEIESRVDSFICSLDARRIETDINTHIAVRKETFYLNIVRLQENSFLTSLKSKLGWGLDTRN